MQPVKGTIVARVYIPNILILSYLNSQTKVINMYMFIIEIPKC